MKSSYPYCLVQSGIPDEEKVNSVSKCTEIFGRGISVQILV